MERRGPFWGPLRGGPRPTPLCPLPAKGNDVRRARYDDGLDVTRKGCERNAHFIEVGILVVGPLDCIPDQVAEATLRSLPVNT